VPIPASVTTVTVTGNYVYSDGEPGVGTVSFYPTGGVWLNAAADGTTIVAKKVEVPLDANGDFTVDLPATNDTDLAPTGTTYDVVVTVGGTERKWSISLPLEDTEVALPALAPVIPSGSASTAVLRVAGKLPDGTGNIVLAASDVGAANATETTNALNGKADEDHTHGIADVTGLQAALNGKASARTPQALVDATTITIDAATGSEHRVTLAGNRTLAVPTNGTDGQMLLLRVTQDATGGRTLMLHADIRTGTDVSTVSLSSEPGRTDFVLLHYSADKTAWALVGVTHGYVL
jgi:hypothetical protein